MSSIALSILALAAGAYLLIQVKNLGLGFIYKLLSWLVVLLALGFILCGVARAGMHMRHVRQCHAEGRCGMGMGCGQDACPYMHQSSCSMHGGSCSMGQSGCSEQKECCAEKKECCAKGSEEGKSACCTKGAEKEMSACCKKAAADSTAKK
jgi:hypothetical protein